MCELNVVQDNELHVNTSTVSGNKLQPLGVYALRMVTPCLPIRSFLGIVHEKHHKTLLRLNYLCKFRGVRLAGTAQMVGTC